MLRSIVLRYRCRAGGSWRYWHGRGFHAGFLDAVGRRQPSLAERLHAAPAFTTAIVAGLTDSGNAPTEPGGDSPRLEKGIEVETRVTSFDSELSQHLDEVAQSMNRLRVGQVSLELIGDPMTTPTEHPFAVWGTADALGHYWLEEHASGGEPPFGSARLEFLSPVIFRHGGSDAPVPMPLPSLLFARLRRIWNDIGPIPVSEETGIALAEGCRIRRYDLGTCEVRLSERAVHTGFVGCCEVSFPDEPTARAGHLLLDLAYFAGIGAKTTMGCGAIAPVGHFGRVRDHSVNAVGAKGRGGAQAVPSSESWTRTLSRR